MARSRGGTPGASAQDSLTPCELVVLRHLGTGLQPAAVAGVLQNSLWTVKMHIKNINDKFATSSYHASVLLARQRGII